MDEWIIFLHSVCFGFFLLWGFFMVISCNINYYTFWLILYILFMNFKLPDKKIKKSKLLFCVTDVNRIQLWVVLGFYSILFVKFLFDKYCSRYHFVFFSQSSSDSLFAFGITSVVQDCKLFSPDVLGFLHLISWSLFDVIGNASSKVRCFLITSEWSVT